MAEVVSPGLEYRLIGGSMQVVADRFVHLKEVVELDEAWFAVTGIDLGSLRADKYFLEFLDVDRNCKVRTDEVKDALRFLLEVLKDGSGFDKREDVLSLDAINQESPKGKQIYDAAKVVLGNLGKPDAGVITLAEIRNDKAIKSCIRHNGDGVIAPDAEEDPEAAFILEQAIKFSGGTADLSGSTGVNVAQLDGFLDAVRKVVAWYEQEKVDPQLRPFGEQTPGVFAHFSAVKEALDSFFLNSETLAFLDCDPERLAKKDSVADVRSPADVAELLTKLSIAAPDADGCLDLSGALNPIWKEKLLALASLPEMADFLEGQVLSADAWKRFSAMLAPVSAWKAAKPQFPQLDALDKAALERCLNEEVLERLHATIQHDLEAGSALAGIDALHKLVLFQCYMADFLENFLNLKALFEPRKTSLLQTGKLVMDGRHFNLAVPVTDLAEHKRIVADSNICTAYVEISRGLPGALQKKLLAVAITSGNMRNLFPGKRGIFFDAANEVYDAKITDFIRQPVSVCEALKSPFYRFGEFLGKQADKFLATKSNAAQQELGKNIAAGKVPVVPEVKPAQPGMNGSMLLMGGSIGIAAIGSSVAFITKTLQNISFLNILAVVFGIILVFGGPIVTVSLVKLYRRDLGRFLEANGCALNFPMRLSGKLGRFFTLAPKRPLSLLLPRGGKGWQSPATFWDWGLAFLLVAAFAASMVFLVIRYQLWG